MHNPSNLMLSRHNVYYFRWPIPRSARVSAKPSHVVLSLGTRQPREALHLARVLEYHASLVIGRFGTSLMNDQDLKVMVQEYCQLVLEERKRQIREQGPLNDDQLAVYRESVENAPLIEQLDSAVKIDHANTIATMIKTMNLDIAKGSNDYEVVRSHFIRAMPAFSAEVLRFNEEYKAFDFKPQLEGGIKQSVKPEPRHTLELVAQKFVTMQMQDKRWDYNTEQEKLAHIEVLKEILGAKYLVKDIDAEKARHVRDIIRLIPKNRTKNPKTRGLSLMDSLEVKDVEKIAPATIKKYLETYIALFGWCVDEGYIEKNHFKALRGRGDQNKGQLQREPFTDQQIILIRNELDKGRDGLANKDYRYWGTLIGMYTGARLNEISQILLEDIKQEDGIWYFDMNDDGDTKKLKNEASRRRVPIHDALLERGIIEYKDKLIRQGKKRFLYELRHDKKNGWGKNLGHFFNQVLLPKLGLKKPELVFHSFRHTVNTRLRQAGVDILIVQSIIGHTLSGGASNIYFNEGYKLADLKAALDKLHQF